MEMKYKKAMAIFATKKFRRNNILLKKEYK